MWGGQCGRSGRAEQGLKYKLEDDQQHKYIVLVNLIIRRSGPAI